MKHVPVYTARELWHSATTDEIKMRCITTLCELRKEWNKQTIIKECRNTVRAYLSMLAARISNFDVYGKELKVHCTFDVSNEVCDKPASSVLDDTFDGTDQDWQDCKAGLTGSQFDAIFFDVIDKGRFSDTITLEDLLRSAVETTTQHLTELMGESLTEHALLQWGDEQQIHFTSKGTHYDA